MAAGQHVGRQSDAIDNEDDDLRAAIRERMKIKPSGKVYKKDGHDLGDGDRCPTTDEHGNNLGHGKMYTLNGGAQWCPHQSHDMGVPRSGVHRTEEPSNG